MRYIYNSLRFILFPCKKKTLFFAVAGNGKHELTNTMLFISKPSIIQCADSAYGNFFYIFSKAAFLNSTYQIMAGNQKTACISDDICDYLFVTKTSDPRTDDSEVLLFDNVTAMPWP